MTPNANGPDDTTGTYCPSCERTVYGVHSCFDADTTREQESTASHGPETDVRRDHVKAGGKMVYFLTESPPPPSETTTERRLDLVAFARRVAQEHFDSQCNGVEGDVFQEIAVDTGILIEMTAIRPCHEDDCACAEVADFPCRCYRLAPDIQGGAA